MISNFRKYKYPARRSCRRRALPALLAAAALGLILGAASPGAEAEAQPPQPAQHDKYRHMIGAMKENLLGPFSAVRWFCEDGTVLPPIPSGCGKHGEGRQHGKLSDEALELRSAGYEIGTVYAALGTADFAKIRRHPRKIAPLLLERFLLARDDGWIYRRALTRRGVFQLEDEVEGAERLLKFLLADPRWRSDYFLLLREAARLLPRTSESDRVETIRVMSTQIARSDRSFRELRNKIHSTPDAEDAERIRAHAAARENPARYLMLADLIDEVYGAAGLEQTLRRAVDLLSPAERAELQRIADEIFAAPDDAQRYAGLAAALSAIRAALPASSNPDAARSLLNSSIKLENQLFALGRSILAGGKLRTRRQHVDFLLDTLDGAYGAGLLTKRLTTSARASLVAFLTSEPTLGWYSDELSYLSLAPQWAEQQILFFFRDTLDNFAQIEPLAAEYPAYRIRGSSLLLFSSVLAKLQQDVGVMQGVKHYFFGKAVSSGLRVLNSGLARGTLLDASAPSAGNAADSGKILLTPETNTEMPRVAGILTMREGNLVSHVQLLAHNLGIPNVVVAEELLPATRRYLGKTVVLAASEEGIVHLDVFRPQLDRYFRRSPAAQSAAFPEKKLNLKDKKIYGLQQISAADSGRIVGPKAAKLAELKRRFPEAVSSAVVLPFGIFDQVVSNSLKIDGRPLKLWIRQQYSELKKLPENSPLRSRRTAEFLATVRAQIRSLQFTPQFRAALIQKLRRYVGDPTTTGIFVRSDTNVEDLPHFTGAGLNKTVPNVVGVDELLRAISEVWASPFSERAFSWRSGVLEDPAELQVSVLLMRSVPVEKSGVLVTQELQGGDMDYVTVAANWGIGGAVSNQVAESLLINRSSGAVKVLGEATASSKLELNPRGGLITRPVLAPGPVLSDQELLTLLEFAESLPERYPELLGSPPSVKPVDVEFGFVKGHLALFQIRPLVAAKQDSSAEFLQLLDRPAQATRNSPVDLSAPPHVQERK